MRMFSHDDNMMMLRYQLDIFQMSYKYSDNSQIFIFHVAIIVLYKFFFFASSYSLNKFVEEKM